MSDYLAFVESAGCGEMFPVRTSFAKRAKWCSQKCRKAQYAGSCEVCGASTNGSNGHGPNASRFCAEHGKEHSAQIMRDRYAPYRARIEELWSDGFTGREICEAIGLPYSEFHVTRWRSRGYDLPYRRTPEQVARLVAAATPTLAMIRSRRGAA